MGDFGDNHLERALDYCAQRNKEVTEKLGGGQDGEVFATSDDSAIKVFKYKDLYEKEREVYMRIFDKNIGELIKEESFRIPTFLGYDDSLGIIEMEMVNPPYILDFAGASLDRPKDLTEEQQIEWELENIDRFGDSWDRVQTALAIFRRFKIYLYDLSLNNIRPW
ncbi:hypothetical protein KOR42_34960 [Thalassoglobus neptunius]|uniref:Phosphotransferase enzyme family protein n=1 Tax=Thalassoglobus neptunius TaxID=1938619 RepID=A0A5C5WLR9_9PLAN|nr:hypothetical protein [Thalassoglobus neptunius]TWT51608.1 hypothetical protein KOR42_34960 [Thalassoglobus neptunius]